ncbi:hypothetical protein IFM89_037122 [Coptis chinensis]|uniref:Transketolase-like pyrimidine-binding domain-containing protein n=1 Tax=Coptis chinensis TaxID=261450 RepID=A0A835H311_9MAGN|nr:hypothetical protein IFM89_037122 [Coptis chinensis]
MPFLLCKRDKELVVVHAGMEMDPSLQLFHASFPDMFFDVGMVESNIMTFVLWLSMTWIGKRYQCTISTAGLVGSDGPTLGGEFDITFMSCLPNMIVMAPADEVELVNMVVTAAHVDDKPICFRYPRGAVGGMNSFYAMEYPWR